MDKTILKPGEKKTTAFRKKIYFPYLETILFQNSSARQDFLQTESKTTCSTDKYNKHAQLQVYLRVWDHWSDLTPPSLLLWFHILIPIRKPNYFEAEIFSLDGSPDFQLACQTISTAAEIAAQVCYLQDYLNKEKHREYIVMLLISMKISWDKNNTCTEKSLLDNKGLESWGSWCWFIGKLVLSFVGTT